MKTEKGQVLYIETTLFCTVQQFLSRVSTLTRDFDIAILSVRPSACRLSVSVAFRYSMETV